MGPLGKILDDLFGGLHSNIRSAMQSLFEGGSNGPLSDLFSGRPTGGSRQMSRIRHEKSTHRSAGGASLGSFAPKDCKT